jgi:hypothetical protein
VEHGRMASPEKISAVLNRHDTISTHPHVVYAPQPPSEPPPNALNGVGSREKANHSPVTLVAFTLIAGIPVPVAPRSLPNR